MFGVFTFGSPYFGDAINITHGAAEPHVIDAFGMYQASLNAFGRYEPTLDGFGRYEDVVDAFANEGEV